MDLLQYAAVAPTVIDGCWFWVLDGSSRIYFKRDDGRWVITTITSGSDNLADVTTLAEFETQAECDDYIRVMVWADPRCENVLETTATLWKHLEFDWPIEDYWS